MRGLLLIRAKLVDHGAEFALDVFEFLLSPVAFGGERSDTLVPIRCFRFQGLSP